MLLDPEKSLCEKNQAIVVSKDKYVSREHRAINPKRKFDLRQYRLDGGLIQQKRCCDYLLINDSLKKAYLIELKGADIDDAAEQLEAAERYCKPELQGYIIIYRIVCSKAKTHKIQSPKFRKFKEKYGMRLKMKSEILSEELE